MLLDLGRTRDAAEAARALSRRRPDYVPAINNLSLALMLDGRTAEAIDAARRSGSASREGRARVPDVAVHVTSKRLDVPSAEGGFDEMSSVRIAGDGRFVVEICRYGERESARPDRLVVVSEARESFHARFLKPSVHLEDRVT